MNKQVVEKVYTRIMELLDLGIIPWKKPWNLNNLAVSYNNGKAYSFLNQILIGEPGEYATFNQIKSLGGKVKKGAKSKFITFWSPIKVKEIKNNEEIEKQIPYLVYYNVFNIATDVEGLKPKFSFIKNNIEYKNAEELISIYINKENIVLDKNGTSAFYSPLQDKIVVPNIKNFTNSNEFYSTLMHEIIHSTGSEKRLNRFNTSKPALFGSEVYGIEELIAECGSTLLCSNCGIETEHTIKNSAAYIQNWKKAINSNKEIVISAFSKAEKAVDFVLNGKKEN